MTTKFAFEGVNNKYTEGSLDVSLPQGRAKEKARKCEAKLFSSGEESQQVS